MSEDQQSASVRRIGIVLVGGVLLLLVALELVATRGPEPATAGADLFIGLFSPLSILVAATATMAINRAVRRWHESTGSGPLAARRPVTSTGPATGPGAPRSATVHRQPSTSGLSEETLREALSMLQPSEREALVADSGYVGPGSVVNAARIDLRRDTGDFPTCGRPIKPAGRRCYRRSR